MICADCKKDVKAYHYCDQEAVAKPRCSDCFEKIGCWETHEEDCVTDVFEIGDDHEETTTRA